MDPTLLQSSFQPSPGDDNNPALSPTSTAPPSTVLTQTHQLQHQHQQPSADSLPDSASKPSLTMDEDGDMSDGGADGAKRPRLRLAHACDRCRKRKIRCDTQQPCGPCSATKNECTFNTPSRRVAKPKPSSRSSSATGLKRPHSPSRGSSSYQASLEARLATLESLLRDVPPNVHNAYLSTLDARLGSGQGVGITQGKGDGVGVAAEALIGSGPTFSPASFSPAFGLKTDATIAPPWSANSAIAGALAGGRGLRRRDERAIDDMARRMENLSFFYEDEIGQAKWQGRSCGTMSLCGARVDNSPRCYFGLPFARDVDRCERGRR